MQAHNFLFHLCINKEPLKETCLLCLLTLETILLFRWVVTTSKSTPNPVQSLNGTSWLLISSGNSNSTMSSLEISTFILQWNTWWLILALLWIWFQMKTLTKFTIIFSKISWSVENWQTLWLLVNALRSNTRLFHLSISRSMEMTILSQGTTGLSVLAMNVSSSSCMIMAKSTGFSAWTSLPNTTPFSTTKTWRSDSLTQEFKGRRLLVASWIGLPVRRATWTRLTSIK